MKFLYSIGTEEKLPPADINEVILSSVPRNNNLHSTREYGCKIMS
jgi:hypothetical protein